MDESEGSLFIFTFTSATKRKRMRESSRISELIKESISVKEKTLDFCLDNILTGYEMIKGSLASGNKLLIFGNGGSASDSSHFASEIVGRCVHNSPAQPAIALSADTAFLTACANDFGFEEIYSRQVEAFAQQGDLAIGISTSGNSPNIIRAFEKAKEEGIRTIGLLGRDGGRASELADLSIVVPSDSTPRIQEVHITIIHTWCQLLEENI
jgi:D-sedoheptulose 7-phosphate isomerase